ncbi:hypothetical protein TRFO_42131 [Tritrichomonas foetus]|uniref:3'-5' exonuclease domain-containing protein n=1 Tax=Tritrichomonas foetus TaxID=1144522 RepID=A0A1J4L1Z9_9EUKA|nr:hypothetical protein TRFO_42131 [Tritrichomonas foetus]|eukprot:OHT15996.1 hypothetical protein TRFO_42131 [Tritrichomonas foetus]
MLNKDNYQHYDTFKPTQASDFYEAYAYGGICFWDVGHKVLVEFFEGEQVPLKIVSIDDPKLGSILNNIDDGSKIALDLEWCPDHYRNQNPIGLYQFCTSKGVLIVKGSDDHFMPLDMKEFFLSHHFYGKGTGNDRIKLEYALHLPFSNLEDIENSLLRPRGLSCNFQQMVENVLGQTPIYEPKDKRVTMSDWGADRLTIRQYYYAAYDVCAVYKVYQKLHNKAYKFIMLNQNSQNFQSQNTSLYGVSNIKYNYTNNDHFINTNTYSNVSPQIQNSITGVFRENKTFSQQPMAPKVTSTTTYLPFVPQYTPYDISHNGFYLIFPMIKNRNMISLLTILSRKQCTVTTSENQVIVHVSRCKGYIGLIQRHGFVPTVMKAQ